MKYSAVSPHVLLIDEAPDIRDLLHALLEDEGYRVTSKASVQSVATVRELAPDLIVHDMFFSEPRPRGWELLRTLRQDPSLAQIPVILCTADGRVRTNQAIARQIQQLALRVVTKPFDLAYFLSVIAVALQDARVRTIVPPVDWRSTGT